MTGETTARLAMPLIHAGQAQKELFHNEALALIDMAAQAVAVSADSAAPPAGPAPGQCWIVAAGASGAWAGRDGAIAGWTAGGWRFLPPFAGMRVWIDDRGHAAVHDGSEWIDEPVRADGYYHGEEKIVGARQAAIAAPAGGSIIDAEARSTVAAILLALQSHGLIAPS